MSLNLDPVLFLPPETASSDVFFYMMDALSARGYKCVAADAPAISVIDHFVNGFGLFLDHIRARRVHLFGAGLGGYLAQVF